MREYDIESGESRVLPVTFGLPAYSPDGRYLAITARNTNSVHLLDLSDMSVSVLFRLEDAPWLRDVERSFRERLEGR